MSELNPLLEQTGNVFTTQVIDNRGSFEINNVALMSSFVEFSASGFYFNEVSGDISSAQLSLHAISNLTDISSVNINILTHLEKRRLEYLVNQGMAFFESKRTSQEEILALFGLSNENMDNSESLDISVNNDNNAKLLAISIILQGSRTVGELTEILASISTDIYSDGVLNDTTIIRELRNQTIKLNLPVIRDNLEKRFENLGLNITIPDFEKYIAEFISFSAQEPTGYIEEATNVETTSANLHAMVNPNSAETVVTFEYGTTLDFDSTIQAIENPINGSSFVPVSANVSELTPGTVYHFRIKMDNDQGVSYSENDKPFSTLGVLEDIEGNIYKTKVYGNQEWMLENLKTTKYNDNTEVLYGVQTEEWYHDSIPFYYWYNDDINNKDIYGGLYNWHVAISDKICPVGWHVPTPDEWDVLSDYLGGESVAGGKMKEVGTEHWLSPNTGASNSSGFTALPSGKWDGEFADLGKLSYWWTTSDYNFEVAWIRYVYWTSTRLRRDGYEGKNNTISIRCIID